MDAFYAQCEMIRLGVPRDVPLAVQQWLVGGRSRVKLDTRERQMLTMKQAGFDCCQLSGEEIRDWEAL